ncbi:MAG: UDP-glucose 4-epimerase GalE [bacterium]
MTILITGGAGYIGSCTTLKILQTLDTKCIVVDKQETSNLQKLLISFPNKIVFYKLNMCDLTSLEEVFKNYKIKSIIHFAAYTIVSESEKQVYEYLSNNINSTLNLVELMVKYNVENLIFSSSASVYGNAKYVPIDEEHPTEPQSTYALSKKICEQIIQKYSSKGIKFITLRYFNPAGCIENLGEEHDPETHLIPILIKSILEGKTFKIFGNNFPTKDGTCIRDFIHIEDLVNAHIISLEKLINNEKINEIYNVGINKGYSVMDVLNKSLEILKKDTNKNFNFIFSEPREGDVPILVANSNKIQKHLGFKPRYDLEDIIYSVWKYEKQKISI